MNPLVTFIVSALSLIVATLTFIFSIRDNPEVWYLIGGTLLINAILLFIGVFSDLEFSLK